MIGNFFNRQSSSANGDFVEPLNLTLAASNNVKPLQLPTSAGQHSAEMAFTTAFWNQVLLNNNRTVNPFLAPSPLQHYQQHHQQQQQQLLAFLALKNHLDQVKQQVTLMSHDQQQTETAPSSNNDNDEAGTKLEPNTPTQDSIVVDDNIKQPASASTSASSKPPRSKKRGRRVSSDALTPTLSENNDGQPQRSSVCIGGYYDANNVFAKLVTVSDEARRKLAALPNVIGDYICALCTVKFDDAFCLAAHNCPKLEKTEHRCPECNKVFSCPANLASHRRWHRPKPDQQNQQAVGSSGSPAGGSEISDKKSKSATSTKPQNRAPKRQVPASISSDKLVAATSKRLRGPSMVPFESSAESFLSRKAVEDLLDLPNQAAPSTSSSLACPLCGQSSADRNELRFHLAGHIAVQLATIQQQQQQQPQQENFVGNLMAAAAAVN